MCALNMAATVPAAKDSYKQLIVERRERVLILKFNRVAAKNTLNIVALYELIRALQEAKHDASVSIVVLTGVGDTFMSGIDLAQLRDRDDVTKFVKSSNYVLRMLMKALIVCPKVLVALVNGPCIGLGFTLSAICDIVYCVDTAYFQAPITHMGLYPEACLAYLMPVILGRSQATKTLLFGEKLTAQEAERSKFVANVFKTEDLDKLFWPKIMEYAVELPAKSWIIAKKLLRLPERNALLRALEEERVQLDKLRLEDVLWRKSEQFSNKNDANKCKL